MKDMRTVTLGLVVMALALVCLLLFSQELAAAPVRLEGVSRAAPAAPAAGQATAWSSGWITVPLGTCMTLTHNLGGDPDDYGLEVWFLDTGAGGEGIHRKYYGGLEKDGQWCGAYWQHLESNTVQVCRGGQDPVVRRLQVRVWELSGPPDFDSGWRDIAVGVANTLVISHNLGITPTELVVTLWFSGTVRGIHHFGYGGLENSGTGKSQGVYWAHLTENTVAVTRLSGDQYVQQVRVVVTHPDPPDYDSLVADGDWRGRNVSASEVFMHALNSDPNGLVVRAECRSAGLGIHQRDMGLTFYNTGPGWQGAYIHNLTSNTVEASWAAWDTACAEMRVRIWRRVARVYLPFVVKEP